MKSTVVQTGAAKPTQVQANMANKWRVPHPAEAIRAATFKASPIHLDQFDVGGLCPVNTYIFCDTCLDVPNIDTFTLA